MMEPVRTTAGSGQKEYIRSLWIMSYVLIKNIGGITQNSWNNWKFNHW